MLTVPVCRTMNVYYVGFGMLRVRTSSRAMLAIDIAIHTYFVMSDSEDSTVTYTEVSSLFEDLSDIGSSGVEGLPMMLEDPYAYVEAALHAPPSPNYVLGPEEPEHAPPSPDFVPELVYLEFMPPKDDVLPAEEQPLLVVVSPTADSLGYITESYPEKDPKEEDEDSEEDPADYPDDRDDEEEEHLASSDSVPPPACCTTTRMSIWDQTPIPFPSAAEVDRFLAISTPSPSPPTSYSSPLPQIPSPPLPVSSPLPVSPPPLPASPTHSLGYRAAMIQLRAELPSTSHLLPLPSPIVLSHTIASMAMMRAAAPCTYILASRSETPPSGTPPLLPIPLPTPSPPLLLPSTECRAGVSEDTDEIYGRLDDAQVDRSLMSGQLNLLRRDKRVRARTMESGARLSCEAWVQSMDANDMARSKVRALRTTVLAQQIEIGDLRAADHRRQTQLTEALTLLRTLQTQMAVLQSQQTPTRDPAHPDVPDEAGSSS
ncbi:hypothetical protein Tco_1575565 [Tanacetum coccineum]